MATAASVLIECLHRHGVRHVFGMPGSHSTELYDAIALHGDIQTTLCRNEQAGAFMADGYARVTGRPGVVCTTAGPGATNALTGIAEAYSDSVPALLLAGQVSHDRINEPCGRYHELDLEGIFRPCVRYGATIMRTADIPAVADRAFAAMVEGRPGPAAIFLPQDLMTQSCGIVPTATPASLLRRAPSEDAIQRARALLKAAVRPIIIAGGGAVWSGAGEVLEDLARRLDCPIVTTLNGKGIVDERAQVSLGHGRTRRARLALAKADLLLAVGCRFTEVFTASGSMPIARTIVHIDVDPQQIGINYPVAVGLEGDARTTLEAIVSGMAVTHSHAWRDVWLRTREAGQLKPEWIVETVRAAIPDDATVFADACEMGLLMQTDFPAYASRSFFYPSNFATLGWGFPASIGGAVGRPDHWTICVAGDGGFQMAMQELATAARYKLKLVVVVHNDSAYGAIKAIQRRRHGARYVDTDLSNPDFVALGESFGVASCRTRDARELASALRAALRREGPSLIDVADQWRSLRM